MYRLKRHPLAIEAHLKRSVALTYAAPESKLKHLLTPGLELDSFEGYGFLVVAMVETEGLRINGFPKWAGISFFLSGYRLFVRHTTRAGKRLRGLKILRSETDSRLLKLTGNMLTHYNYEVVKAEVEADAARLAITISKNGHPNLTITGDLSKQVLPEFSIFRDEKQARAFAGPMPFTFDYEKETHSMISVQGVRSGWTPSLFDAEVSVPPDFSGFGLDSGDLTLASAFQIENVPYRWKRGVVEALP